MASAKQTFDCIKVARDQFEVIKDDLHCSSIDVEGSFQDVSEAQQYVQDVHRDTAFVDNVLKMVIMDLGSIMSSLLRAQNHTRVLQEMAVPFASAALSIPDLCDYPHSPDPCFCPHSPEYNRD